MEDREEKISRIEKLKRDLYSRNKQESLSRRSRLSKNNEGLSKFLIGSYFFDE